MKKNWLVLPTAPVEFIEQQTTVSPVVARALIEDDCPASEIARTIGCSEESLRRVFAGRFDAADATLYRRALEKLADEGIHLYRTGVA